MTREIAKFSREGFTATALELEDLSVVITADADIDADGANGQKGQRAAYMVGNSGSELLGNGGMKMEAGKVVGAASWYKDIVILDVNGQPREFPGGVIASKTAYRWHDKLVDDPAAYVDSETINYVCVPPEIRERATGIVMGCAVKCYYRTTGKTAWGMVADVGPRDKVGEISIAMARALGMCPSPRNGGEERALIEYTFYPSRFAEIDGVQIPMITMRGKYVFPEVEGEDLGELKKI
jgi:hypothetical protein